MTEPIIRPIRLEDAADWHASRTTPGVIWGTMQLPTLSLDDVRAQCAATPTDYKLVAELDGRVVGSVSLHSSPSPRRRHEAGLGIAIHDDFQGRGLGRRLMEAALDLADNWLMLERVELGVYADNARAIHLYESLGFEMEGKSPAYAMRDGAWATIFHMGRLRGRAVDRAAVVIPGRSGVAGSKVTPVIRAMTPGDVEAVFALPLPDKTPATQVDEVRKQLTGLPRGHHLLVAETEGQVVGFARLSQFGGRRAHAGSISAIAVHPAWQGRGIGTALLGALLNLADRWLGLRRLELQAPATSPAALALFGHAGFTTEAILRAALIEKGRFVDMHLMGRIADTRL